MSTLMAALSQIPTGAMVGAAAMLLTGMAVVQVVLLVRLQRRVSAIERVHARLDHFAEALTLLTDTTEQGLENVAAGMQALGRRMTTRGGTRALGRRIADAARGGRALSAIAADEALSESEVRLHVGLQQAPKAAAIRLAASQKSVVRGQDAVREEETWQAASTSR
jgi:hypothetical protein